MQNYTYLIINIACILIPLVVSFYPKHSFFKEWRYFLPANVLVALPFLIWDYVFTDRGIWGFNPDYLSGIYLLNLPLEEVLFFICIPYACVFTYFALTILVTHNPLRKLHSLFTVFMIVTLGALGFYFFSHLYTSVTFIATSFYLVFKWVKKRDLSYIYLAYLVIVPFFLMSNGILTGSWIEEPIVWYNNQENMGLRIITIPVEDSIYGFLLIMMNIDLYLYFKRHFKKSMNDRKLTKHFANV